MLDSPNGHHRSKRRWRKTKTWGVDGGAITFVRDRTRAGKSAGRQLADPRRVDLRPYSDVRRLRRRYDRLVGAVADPRLADSPVGIRSRLSVVKYRLDGRRPRRRPHRRPHWA